MDDHFKVVEINGVKMEVDLRTARVIENYKVGDSVKLLKKRYDSYEVLPAAIIGFTEFQKLPTIELIALKRDGDVEFFTFNAETKDTEIAPFNRYEAVFEREEIMDKLTQRVNQAEEALRVARTKREAFQTFFAKVFKNEMVGTGAEA